ncbi:MAG: hypothetical protein K2X47_19155, partial [Bdellovibrionales bacterium]|nr:hypothetical protein [Bdellovibrionales bacterium]
RNNFGIRRAFYKMTVLFNLESLGKEGEVNICMSKCGSVAKINIVDNGSGIPTHILSKLGQEAITFGRTNGNGLGVIHAFQTIQNLDGKIKFVSQENRGTTVEIQIPISKDYISKESSSTRQVVVIDDDPLIHQAMDLKFSADQSNLDLIHFYSYRDAARWYSKASRISGRLFLVDYDLEPEGPNGLDLIENLGIKAEAVLVTGRHDDPEVLFRADQLGVRVFGKDLLSQIQAENLDLIAGAMNEHS